MSVLRAARAVVVCSLLASCSASPKPATPKPDVAADEVPLFPGLGTLHRSVTTMSPEAQKYFDQGLAFMYAFNHDEAIRSFRKAATLDPKCAMAEWGIALANGPHINFPMLPPERAKAAHEAMARARTGAASPVERELIAALDKRYHDPEPEDRKPLDQAYADAMRGVYAAHPDDADIAALFAEAMMDLRPWDLWKDDGSPQPGTEEIVATLEKTIAKSPQHPLANHLYIHAVEASREPGRATAAADRLRTMQPGLGHLVHMPSHIDVRTGRWEEAIAANRAAIDADARYTALRPQQGFYRVYMAHNRHMLTLAAMMTGKSELAIKTIREMVEKVPPAFIKENAAVIDGFLGMPFEVLMRFGKWDAILAEPEPTANLPIARLLRRYARGVAFAAKGDLAHAREEQKLFLDARAQLPKDATFGNNAAHDLMLIAEHVLAGEILFNDGKQKEGIAELRLAVSSEDKLRYAEPPDWIQPVRHALGAALMRASLAKEAEDVYREDLTRLPNNVWSYQGLARSLRVQKRDAEAKDVEAKLAKAMVGADIELTSSCMCLPGI